MPVRRRALPAGPPLPAPAARGLRSSLVLALVLGGCDLPTEAPVLESLWIVPGLEATVEVDELLPPDIVVGPDREAFSVSVDPVTASSTVGEMCPACIPSNGFTVPKPAFEARFEGSSALPEGVRSAILAPSTVDVEASHDFAFDPLRPGGEERGSIVLSVRSGGILVAADTVRGATTAFGPNDTITRTLALPGGTRLVSPVVLEVTLVSPEGGPLTLDVSGRLTVTGTAVVAVAEALVDVGGETVDLPRTVLDVAGVDEGLVERVERGAFVLEISNPWGVGLPMTLTIQGGLDGPVVKQLDVAATATSLVEIDFTGPELRSFLGQEGVALTGSGRIPDATGPAVLRPDQRALIDADLALTLRVGG